MHLSAECLCDSVFNKLVEYFAFSKIFTLDRCNWLALPLHVTATLYVFAVHVYNICVYAGLFGHACTIIASM